MSCPDVNELQALADGTLADGERDSIFAHTDGCEECRDLLTALGRQVTPGSVSTPPQPPARRKPSVVFSQGAKVGRYQIDRLLGSGGLGVVYAAHDPELGRRVALKLLKVDPGAGSQERLVREARALARISHPNVVAVYDVGVWQDRVFVAMELVAGRDLRAWLAERPRRRREVVDVFLAAGRGLAAAHLAGLVHRDFKPENVLVGDDGRVRVSDFGLARAFEDIEAVGMAPPDADDPLRTPVTQAGAITGTPAYMAPEQHEGGLADARSDQFAFCASLFEALHGARPFAGGTYAELRAEVLAGRIRGALVPRSLDRLVRRGLAVTPGDRWPSLTDLLVALGRDRSKLPRRAAAVSAALLAVLGTALAADWIVRDRDAAIARTSFAAAGQEIERALRDRYQTFAALAELSTMLPIVRAVAAERDQAAFGLGSHAADIRELEALHASLRDADWEAWIAATRLGAVAIADYKGRLVYVTTNPAGFGNDVRQLAAAAAAYRPGGPGSATQVLGTDDPALVASGLALDAPGLVVLFAHASVLAGVPQAAFIQVLSAGRLLVDLEPPTGVELGLIAPDGKVDGAISGDLLAAAAASREPVEVRHDGRPWLVVGQPLPGLQPGAPVATLVMARRADVGLAGLFPEARAILIAAAGAALLLLGASLLRLFTLHR